MIYEGGMRYQPDQKGEARANLLLAIGRGFRRQGYGGIGVDGLAREAGVTSGAFYGHFKSKDDAFDAAAVAGLAELRAGVARLQAERGGKWIDAFVDLYLGDRVACELGESCGLQSLTPDVMRAGDETKARYEKALLEVAEQLAAGLPGKTAEGRRQTAWALMALLSGGVTMARSVASGALQKRVVVQLKRAARVLLAAV